MRSEDTRGLVISKTFYDQLVSRYPLFMQTVWVQLPKEWFANYVYVRQCAGSGLATLLNSLEYLTCRSRR